MLQVIYDVEMPVISARNAFLLSAKNMSMHFYMKVYTFSTLGLSVLFDSHET